MPSPLSDTEEAFSSSQNELTTYLHEQKPQEAAAMALVRTPAGAAPCSCPLQTSGLSVPPVPLLPSHESWCSPKPWPGAGPAVPASLEGSKRLTRAPSIEIPNTKRLWEPAYRVRGTTTTLNITADGSQRKGSC
ncbi:hypothetical protein AV530_001197 [Patagioenas fasciata monilis]|uniref:Uncharacterized protein n=1 Tax=Patagioenas fasciata monilis TaxID=372326 RepID=A0A1V4KTS3_PATFA|nr:hypothetical protein AV530_001197 [Patagioenas fasciata monilis]